MVGHSLPVDALIQTWTICVCVSGSDVGLLAVYDFLYIVGDCGLWLV